MSIPKRVKIFIVIIASFFLSSFVFTITTSPDKFKPDLSQAKEQIYQAKNSFSSAIGSFFQLKLFSKTQSDNNLTDVDEQKTSFSDFETLPTSPQKKPTGFYPSSSPTKSKYPTAKPITPGSKIPTPTIKPSAKPTKKPTKIPTPTVKPIGIQRPGTSLGETLAEVGPRTCVPTALLRAILDIESGGRLSSLSRSEFTLFNRFAWWNEKTTTLTQVCKGIAYNHHTGLVPSGAQYAGSRCMGAETFSTDIFSMGFISISQWEEDSYRSQVLNLLRTDKIDRRVIYDSLIIAGMHFKNISTYRGDNCNDWEAKYIAKTACKYHGGCLYNYGGNSGDYCQQVCDGYNRYTSGKKANCANVSSLIGSQCAIK